MRVRIGLLLLVLTCASGSSAQDVASVKVSPPAPPNRFGFPVRASIRIEPGPTLNASQATLRELVLRVYGLQPFQLVGGPEWFDAVRYDVVLRGDFRVLLTERFTLRLRTEPRELPIYNLVAVKPGAVGPRLTPSSIDCSTPSPDCDPRMNMDMAAGTMTLSFKSRSMAELARTLTSPDTGRRVVDRTGIEGRFEGSLVFAPAPLPGLPPPPASDNGVALVTALQEQFGLKLEPARGPVDVMVVERAERPAEN
jgi:uncharacterized protein (TIGR03435 family)